MHIVLIPGLWLDGASWDAVVPVLEQAGHNAHPVTLPGMESTDADRSGVSLQDVIGAVIGVIDACDPDDGRVLLVAHSAGGGIVHAAVDARPDRVARVIYVGGFPAGDGEIIADGFATDGGDIPFPGFEAFEGADLAGLDETALASFRNRVVPSPAALATEPLRLGDDRRYEIPATAVCTEYAAEMLVGWMGQLPELSRIRHLEFVDLPTGHWPQFTRPDDLGAVIAARAYEPLLDEYGRLHPPDIGAEVLTALGFLDYQRATLEWKTRGLDAAGLNATTAASTLTLGGLLKHMAWVEDIWFSVWLHDRAPSPPWNDVDWKANPDWEFASATADDPEELQALWRQAVLRSRAATAAAIAAGGFDQIAARTGRGGERVNLRWIVLHMIEEYARHNGHADLLRESIDGQTGE
jgi:pimeloyl-ACP methyl ester carboxylesterase